MRCIGTLEFVSDFHNKCHQTQRELLLDKERLQGLVKDEIITDCDSDKENTSPQSNIEKKENLNGKSTQPKRRSNHVEKKLGNSKKIKYDDSFDEHTILGSNNVQNAEENEASIRSETDGCNEAKPESVESKGYVISGRKTPAVWKRNPRAKEVYKGYGNIDDQKSNPVSRYGRKMNRKKAGSSSIVNTKVKNIEEGVSRSSLKNDIRAEKSTTQFGGITEIGNSINAFQKKEKNVRRIQGRPPSSTVKEKISGASPDMVRMENFNSDKALLGAAARVETDKLVRVPRDIITSVPDKIVRKLTANSPQPGDEAGESRERGCERIEEKTANNTFEITSVKDDGIRPKSLSKTLTIRKSVIESVKNGKTFGVDIECGYINENESSAELTLLKSDVTCQRKELEPINVYDSFGSSTTTVQESSSIDLEELTVDESKDVENFRNRRRTSEGQFGKLSELMTNEQKEIIESMYSVNMGVVNEEEVIKNIKILDKLKVKCEICGKTYPRMDKCQVHIWGHLNMKPYRCKSCDFVTLTVSNIRCHIRKRHLKIKPFQCNLCEKAYGTAVLLEEHINSHTGAKPYKCKLCDFATSNRQVLSYHKTTHKSAKDISCEVCGKKFFSNCRMRAHMIVHNKDRSLMCKLCSTYLCNSKALEKHYQKVHSRDYVCNICGVRTRSKKALTNHENVHSEAKYGCPICSNVYKSKHMLKEHLLKHQGIRKYKCELCQKSFAQQSHIAAHMSVHMGKRYPCPGCHKLFNRRDNMRIHTKRCKIFKSNLDTKALWADQDSTRSLDKDAQSIPVSEIPSTIGSLDNLKTDKQESETDLGLLTINLLTSKTDYSKSHKLSVVALQDSQMVSEAGNLNQFKSSEGEVLRIGEVDIFPLPNSGVVGIQNESKTVITENVLSPECF